MPGRGAHAFSLQPEEIVDTPTPQELAHYLRASGRLMPGVRAEDIVGTVPPSLFAAISKVFQEDVAQDCVQMYQRRMLQTHGNVLASTSVVVETCLRHVDDLIDQGQLSHVGDLAEVRPPSPRAGLMQQQQQQQ